MLGVSPVRVRRAQYVAHVPGSCFRSRANRVFAQPAFSTKSSSARRTRRCTPAPAAPASAPVTAAPPVPRKRDATSEPISVSTAIKDFLRQLVRLQAPTVGLRILGAALRAPQHHSWPPLPLAHDGGSSMRSRFSNDCVPGSKGEEEKNLPLPTSLLTTIFLAFISWCTSFLYFFGSSVREGRTGRCTAWLRTFQSGSSLPRLSGGGG